MRLLAVVLVAGALASAASAAFAGTSKPHLRVVRTHGLVVAGSNFRSGERVTVVAHAAREIVVHTRARGGSFSARLGAVPMPRCKSVQIVATGSLGSRATMTLQRPTCTPPVSP
jgi:hypothetical protein